MDAQADLATAPFRDARFAPRRLEVEHRPGGELVLSNPTPFETRFATMTAALEHWALKARDRVWLAERSGAGWRTVTYGEAREQVATLAAGLLEMDVVRLGPLLILAHNGVDNALIAYAAM